MDKSNQLLTVQVELGDGTWQTVSTHIDFTLKDVHAYVAKKRFLPGTVYRVESDCGETSPKYTIEDRVKNRVLVFPKGTIIKYDGIPCELLQDTPYESEHYRQASKRED